VASAAIAAALLVTASAQAVVIEGGVPTGAPGETVDFSVTLRTEGAEVAGTENVISWAADSGLSIIAKSNGRPDCEANPDLQKDATSFAFQPSGCSGSACTGMKALVLALDNVDAIADGSVLYTCRVSIADSATGCFQTLSIDQPGASDPRGGALATTGVDGRIELLLPSGDSGLSVGDASAEAGSTVTVAVSLSTFDAVAFTQNTVTFAPPLAIAAMANGKPDCAVNDAINKGGTEFDFYPTGCSGDACTGVRALVLAFDNVDPIPDGSTLYACRVIIDADAPAGEYVLGCTDVGLADVCGYGLSVVCSDGTVTVHGVSPPTATPTETPQLATRTNTPMPNSTSTAAPTASHTGGPLPPNPGDDDACAIAAPADVTSAWIALVPLAALLWLRRRPRRQCRFLRT